MTEHKILKYDNKETNTSIPVRYNHAIDGARGVVLLVRPPGDPSDAPAATSPSDWHLTPREQDILSLLVDGRSNRTIAAALDVGERTVETHLSAMFGKAGVASRAELVARARRA